MAACIRVFSALRNHLLQNIAVSPVTRSLTVKYPRDRLTWSQLRFLHSRSTGHACSVLTQPSRSRWQWLIVMATAGFSQGFLGFSFGKKDKEEEKGSPLKHVYMEAKEAHMKQDFYTAEIRYHDAIKVAEEMLKLKKINFKTYIYAKTNIYDSLADMALGQGQLEKAEKLYKETMKGCLQQGVPQTGNAVVELSLKLASIYAMLDRQKEAEQGLLFCINTQDAKLSKKARESSQVSDAIQEATTSAKAEGRSLPSPDKPTDDDEELQEDTEALLGMALETYGRFLMGNRRLSEAVKTLERAESIGQKVLGSHAGQYINLVNDLATAHMLLKNYDKAADILNEAIKSATESQSSQLPMLYCNLGAMFLRKSKLREAEEACLKGKELSANNQHSMAASMSKKCLEKIAQVKKAA